MTHDDRSSIGSDSYDLKQPDKAKFAGTNSDVKRELKSESYRRTYGNRRSRRMGSKR